MGSPVSPTVANLFMEHFEAQAISRTPNPPRFWARYVDDTFVVHKKDQIDSFTGHINGIHPAIKFTIEREDDNKLAMLDTLVHRQDDCSLKTTVYRKATHTDQYLSFQSHHPLQHKLGVIRTLYHQADTVISDQLDIVKEKEHLQDALKICGYDEWTFKIVDRSKSGTRPHKSNKRTIFKGSVTLPYIQGVSEGMR